MFIKNVKCQRYKINTVHKSYLLQCSDKDFPYNPLSHKWTLLISPVLLYIIDKHSKVYKDRNTKPSQWQKIVKASRPNPNEHQRIWWEHNTAVKERQNISSVMQRQERSQDLKNIDLTSGCKHVIAWPATQRQRANVSWWTHACSPWHPAMEICPPPQYGADP